MIRVDTIWKYFEGTPVLRDVSLDFEQGKTNLIIGRSGSGKTVLMKCLVGLLEADKGKIYYDKHDFSAMSFRQRRVIRKELGMLFQGSALFDSLTVEENITFPLNMFTTMTPGEKRKRVDFCLDRVNLGAVHGLYPSELSGGMKKRAAIAGPYPSNQNIFFATSLTPDSILQPEYSLTN